MDVEPNDQPYDSIADGQLPKFVCVVPPKSLKLLGKIIQCLDRVGEELFWDAQPDRLELTTMNPGRSAYFKFVLFDAFFETYAHAGVEAKYKTMMKPCLAVFKTAKDAKCTIKVDDSDSKMIFELDCEHSVRKTHKVNLEEGLPQHAIYDKSRCTHSIIAKWETITNVLSNFPPGLDEITLGLGRQWVTFKSCIDDTKPDENKAQVMTEMRLDVNDFDKYDLGVNAMPLELSFSLREFKAASKFCEVPKTHLHGFMTAPGQPIIFSTRIPRVLEADFVLATQSSPETSASQQNPVEAAGPSQIDPKTRLLTPKKEPPRSSYDSSGTYGTNSSASTSHTSSTPTSSSASASSSRASSQIKTPHAISDTPSGRPTQHARVRDDVDQLVMEHQTPTKRQKTQETEEYASSHTEGQTGYADDDEMVPDSQE